MLLVWRGSETSHRLGEERQNFRATFHGFLQSGAKVLYTTFNATPATYFCVE